MTITIPPRAFFESIRIVHDDRQNFLKQRRRARYRMDHDDDMVESSGNKRKRTHDHPGASQAPGRQSKKHKTSRVHPKDAHHQIENLPSLPQEFKRGEKLNAVELAKSLGLELRGAGTNVEVWYVGQREEPSEGLAESTKVTSKSPEVVYLGTHEKQGEELPLRLKDGEEDPTM